MAHALRRAAPFVLVAASFVLVYAAVFVRLVDNWIRDANYSHGFLIIPLALFFAWQRRGRLSVLPPAPSNAGLIIVIASLGVLLAGALGAEVFLSRISFVGVVAGSIVFVLGWRALRVLAFPVALLVLMIPIPALIFNQIAFPLQLFASQVGETTLRTLGIPVLREGNVLVLANVSLEVAEACSGIRSLMSLLTLGIIYGYFADSRTAVRIAIALATIPIAIASNGIRVAGTGVAAHYFGPQAAEGFLHTFSGWLMFIVAFMMLFVLVRLLMRLVPPVVHEPRLDGAAVA